MAGVENDQSQNNLIRMVDVFNFVALTSAIKTLLLTIINNNSSLRIIINAMLSILVYFLTIFNGLTWIFPAEFMFVILLHVLPITTETFAIMLLFCFILFVICLICLVGFLFAGILFFWKKLFPGTADFSFISAKRLLMIIEDLIILLITGCASLLGWKILQEVRCTLGFVLVGFLGFSSSFCCVYRLVYKWKEYHRASAMESSVTPAVTTAKKDAV